ncbi:MAG: hypothetical protein NVSMB49_28470 [Ktedonobacteraceae bacterium]
MRSHSFCQLVFTSINPDRCGSTMSFREQPNATVTTTAVWPGSQLTACTLQLGIRQAVVYNMNGEFDPGSG